MTRVTGRRGLADGSFHAKQGRPRGIAATISYRAILKGNHLRRVLNAHAPKRRVTLETYPNDDDQLALLEAQRILAASGVAAPPSG